MLGFMGIVCVTAGCPSSGGDTAGSGSAGTGASGGSEWSGDPCTLLADSDFGALNKGWTLSGTDGHNVGSSTFSPECHFSLHGDGTSAAVAVFVDKASDFQTQKTLFKGEAVSGVGKDAWRGNDGGKGNSTVGVLLANFSFRVDSTYELSYDDLVTLAKAIAPRIK